MPDRAPRPESHRLAGWLLILVALLAAALGAGIRFWPHRLTAWTGRPAEELTRWWLPGALAGICLVAFLVGLRFAFRRRAHVPSAAKRAAGGNRLVEIEPTPARSPAPVTPGSAPERRPSQDTPAFWPADQAVGMGWAKASDAVQQTPPAPSPPPQARPIQPP